MLTTQQLQTLKAAILADPNTAGKTSGPQSDYQFIMDYWNAGPAPAYTVWRTNVSRAELQDMDEFNWTQVDNLSTGSKYRIWEWMFGLTGYINASKANIRAGIAACWTGNAQLALVQTAILTKCKRSATRTEKLFAGAPGAGTVADPATLVFEGAVSFGEIAVMFNA